jgi:hypothetical protein
VTVGLPPVPVTCDALIPRRGEGTEFRSVRYGDFKYVRFRNALPLLFSVTEDPGEQENLLAPRRPPGTGSGGATGPQDADPGAWDAEVVQAILSALPNAAREVARFANASIDFNEVEEECTVREGSLKSE